MALEFRKQRDGRLRDTWFGSFEVNGKRLGIDLGVQIGESEQAEVAGLAGRGLIP